MLKISAFPKCYLDQIAGHRSLSVFDWIEMARSLDADGLEMYDGFFTSLDDAYIDRVGDAIREAGFAMPMLCCSPDFTNPDADARRRAVEREGELIRVTRRLGGPGTVCRVLSGQRYPEVGREQGLEWVVACIEELLPIAITVGDEKMVAPVPSGNPVFWNTSTSPLARSVVATMSSS